MSPVHHSPENTDTPAEDICKICSLVLDNTQTCFCTPCKHIFHKSCLEALLEKEKHCPICESEINVSSIKLVVGNCSPKAKEKHLSLAPSTSRAWTRNFTKQLSQVPRDRAEQLNEPAISVSEAPASCLDASHSSNQPEPQLPRTMPNQRRARPNRGNNTRPNREIDYTVIQNMIEQTVSRVVSSLSMNLGQREVPLDTVQTRSLISSPCPTTVQNAKIANVMQKWNLRFNGSTEGLGVEEFIYRVEALTEETLDSDFIGVGKHIQILFGGKAREWYWRFHKQVPRIVWSEFCSAIRQQYKDYRSDFMSKEMIRARKQKAGESFVCFYDEVASLIAKFGIKLEEEELMEILQNNLLPEIRQMLLYQSIASIGHLRRLVQMQENLTHELSPQVKVISNTKANGRRQIFEIQEGEPEDNKIVPDPDEEYEVAAVQGKFVCWNCREAGHTWQNCLEERTIFCYGCGTANVYKPQCQDCIKRLAENRPKGASRQRQMLPQ